MGSDPTQGLGEVFVGLSGYVAFEARHDFWVGESFVSSSGHVGFGFGVAAHAGEDDAVKGCVGSVEGFNRARAKLARELEAAS